MNFGEALKRIRTQRNLSQEELATILGTSKQVISRYENGQRSPKISVAAAFAAALDVPMSLFTDDEPDVPPGLEVPAVNSIPLLGEIACGEPITAEENIEGTVKVDYEVHCDFALRCKGDSMAPRLLDGDLVFIKQQPSVDNGQIAAVLIDAEATLKHVYVNDSGIQLIAENPAYAPIVLTGDDAENARIIGRAVAYRRNI